MHRILAQAMKQAVKWQLLGQNPCDAVSPAPMDEIRKMLHGKRGPAVVAGKPEGF
jgi:hypothetical protein